MEQLHYLKSIFKPENFSSQELELILMQFEEVKFKKKRIAC